MGPGGRARGQRRGAARRAQPRPRRDPRSLGRRRRLLGQALCAARPSSAPSAGRWRTSSASAATRTRCCEEREFFIRKAIGWVLRDTSRTRPELVYAWLRPRAAPRLGRHRARGGQVPHRGATTPRSSPPTRPVAHDGVMKVLVAVASRHGATREIGEAIGRALGSSGVEAHVRAFEEAGELTAYDAFVLGSAIYMGRWLEPARDFVEAQRRDARRTTDLALLERADRRSASSRRGRCGSDRCDRRRDERARSSPVRRQARQERARLRGAGDGARVQGRRRRLPRLGRDRGVVAGDRCGAEDDGGC